MVQVGRGGADLATMREAFAGPGQDTRQWVSFGTVFEKQNVDDATIEPVEFDSEFGAPLVNVKLAPSGYEVRCRVAGSVAGNGEGQWHPFVPGDEVIVLIPEGDERCGPVIVGRMNNSIDKWPDESIAGQDPTNNTFAFERRRTPFVAEYAASYMLRSAVHGAFILISDTGMVTIRDGSKGSLQIGPDIFGFMEGGGQEAVEDPDATPEPKALFQLDLTGRRATLQVDDASIILNSSEADASAGQLMIASPGQVIVGIGTNLAANACVEHVLTFESFYALLDAFANALGAPAAGPVAMTALDGIVALGGGPLTPTRATAVASGKTAAANTPKLPPDPATGVQLLPGLGAVQFQTG